MKRSLLALIAAVIGSVSIVNAQAPRFVLFEHFTNAGCGPCASQNPGFENNIIIPNPGVINHVAYHTSGPGFDPMNTYNPTDVSTRAGFYGLSGVPTVYMQGNKKEGGPSAFTQTDVNNTFGSGSPIRISVSEIDNGSNRDVTVDIRSFATAPAGSYKLYVAIVEDPKDYVTPPGSNGETHFPNTFRDMITSINGNTITLPAVGSNSTFNFNYIEDATNWNLANIKVIAWVQHATTKEVLNSANTVNIPNANYNLTNGVDGILGSNAVLSSFNLSALNSGTATEDFVFTLTSDAPGDWTSTFSVGSNNFTTTGTVNFLAGASEAIIINVTPGPTPAAATYTLSVSSVQNPGYPALIGKVYVISGVTDLIVNNSGALGNSAAGSAANWQSSYVNGLTFAANTTFGKTNDIAMARLAANAALTNVGHIYFNVGWTFPSFSSDNIVTVLQNFMNGGGNLMICGQDIGWDTYGSGGYGTAATKSFYTNYMKASYSADGGTGNNSLNPNASDVLYGAMGNRTINNFYGGSYFYPDEINAVGIGSVIFTYPTTTKKGGVRATNGTYKMVYIAPGMEMFSTTNANDIIKITHDWFHGLISSTEEFDALMLNLGQNYPNPANDYTTIPVDNMKNNSTLTIIDMNGKTVYTTEVKAGSSNVVVPVNNLGAGIYKYFLQNENEKTESKSMSVVK